MFLSCLVHLFIHMFICPFICICSFICPSVRSSVHLFISSLILSLSEPVYLLLYLYTRRGEITLSHSPCLPPPLFHCFELWPWCGAYIYMEKLSLWFVQRKGGCFKLLCSSPCPLLDFYSAFQLCGI